MNSNTKPLTSKQYVLEKIPGKGGWTYASIPEVPMDKNNPFGWVKVRGMIDGYAFDHYHLMPMGNGNLFLPVKAEIRKAIKKQVGDTVFITLYLEETPLEIPEELLACLKEEPNSYRFFQTLTEGEQHAYIKWIYAAKTDQTKVDRIAKLLERLSRGLKFTDI